MNTTISMQRRFAALLAFVALGACEAGIATMGLNKDKMPVDVNDVLHTFERARRLQFFEMRGLQTTETVSIEDFIHNHDDHDHMEEDAGQIDYEDLAIDVEEGDEISNHSQSVAEFVENQEELHSNATVDINLNETAAEDDDSTFFAVEDTAVEIEAPVAEFATAEVTETDSNTEPVRDEIAFIGRTSVETGPRGGTADVSPKLQPTELSFMIVMEDFRYSHGVSSLDDIKIGTKFGFTGRIVTQAEQLGVASGSCTVTSDIKKELSYCDIYHKIDTDNFGGYGSVMVAGTADDIGGRFLVTGTGGSLQTTQQGYAMVQFDPAGNPVLYVLLKLF